ncbi:MULTISPECIES: hypothetical protein [Achromobacter]|uniref:hypothetical protein n=1 Tax=Achromobacter TaxID=222 RepID=UPI000478CE1F|nr:MULTISPECIES: hypothetical protein [Achromobacter]CAB3737176.1 hypothetical protein LMG1866_05177 [Achromobacter ruhlandii]CUJ42266.1 Uncharacterised protein [Achromobacter xylosoxidans]CUR74521.1 hypothetical protein BN2905_35000 [Achromobacter xylosoxidans]
MEVSTDSKFAQASQAPEVAYLPTAGLQPVKNAARRGRLPKGVALIRRPAVCAGDVQAAPAITDPIETVRQMLASMQASLNFAVAMLAEYEKAHRRAG